MLGLRRLKLDAIWLELLPATNDPRTDQARIANFQQRLREHGLAGRYCLLYQKPANDVHDFASMDCIGISKRDLLERLGGPNVLLNLSYSLHPPLLLQFERRIFCDLDPSEIFYWMTKMELGQSHHHEFWTIGSTLMKTIVICRNLWWQPCRLRRRHAYLYRNSLGKHFIRWWIRNSSSQDRGRAHRNSQRSGNGIGVGRWRSPVNFPIYRRNLRSDLT